MGKKKFDYGFDATVQQRNTINRQINRLRRRGYIVKDSVRALIKSPENVAGQLYRLIKFKPEYGKTPEGESKRVRWELLGLEGRELEKTLQKINRKRRQQATKEGKDFKPLTAAGVLPAVTTTRYPDVSSLTAEVRRRMQDLKEKSVASLSEWEAKRLARDKETFLQSVRQLYVALDPIRSWVSRELITEAISGMSKLEWERMLASLPSDPHEVWTYYKGGMAMSEVVDVISSIAQAAMRVSDDPRWVSPEVEAESEALTRTRKLWDIGTIL